MGLLLLIPASFSGALAIMIILERFWCQVHAISANGTLHAVQQQQTKEEEEHF